MSGVVLPWPKRSIPRRLGPVPAILAGSQVLNHPSGPLLELRLTVSLVDVPAAQRRPLAGLLHSGNLMNLTLDTDWGGEGG